MARQLIGTMLLIAIVVGATYGYLSYRPLGSGVDACSTVRLPQPRQECVTRATRALLERQGRDRALEQVDRLAGSKSGIESTCHTAVHPIGEEAGRADARRHRPMRSGSFTGHCSAGYVHGYMIGYLRRGVFSTPPEAVTAMEATCTSPAYSRDERGAPSNPGQCIHSFGHAIYRVFDGSIDRTITACMDPRVARINPLPMYDWQHECMYGAFMEDAIADAKHGRTKQVDVCSSIAAAVAMSACYAYLPGRIGLIGGSWESIAHVCESVSVGARRTICLRSMGRAAAPVKPSACRLLSRRADRATCSENMQSRPPSPAKE